MHVRATSFLGAWFVIIAVGASLAPPARATSMPERTADEVVADSELVIEATVLSARVARVGGRLVTYRVVRVDKVLKAALPAGTPAPSSVTVVLPGGELDGIGQRVAGTPELVVGGRYLLCLSAPVLQGARTVVGLWQGVWRVDGDGGLRPFTHDGEASAGERVLP